MSDATSPGPVSVPAKGAKPSTIGLLLQIAALVFAVPAMIWGIFIVWSTAFPPKCGDWSGLTDLGVLECWVVDIPIGLAALAIGLSVKKGAARLRRVCVDTSLVLLSFPVIASLLLHWRHCP